MVRKDVKLGFIIGGVLLLVVVVYALLATGDKKKGAQLTKVDPNAVAPDSSIDSKTGSNTDAQSEPPPPAPETPVAEKNDKETPAAATQAVAKPSDPFAAGPKEDDRWLMALNHGQMPTLMSATPAPSQNTDASTAKPESVQISPTTKPTN